MNEAPVRRKPKASPPSRTQQPGWFAAGLLLFSAILIAYATLTPGTGGGGMVLGECALFCGERWVADGIANVILFLPLGFGLGIAGVSARRAFLLGLLLSILVESAQLSFIPGRDANLTDLVSNTLGAFLGALAAGSFHCWINPAPRIALRLLCGAGVAVVATVALTGLLLSPVIPDRPLFGQWAAYRGPYVPFSGEVISAAYGSTPVPPSGPASPSLRGRIAAGDSLRVELRVGRPIAFPAQVVRVADGPGDILLVSVLGNDLVLHYRARAARFRLDQPVLRLPGALADRAPGDRLTLEVWKSRTGFCMRAGESAACPAYTPASGWGLLQNVSYYPERQARFIGLLWMFLLGTPLGLWFRRNRPSLLVGAATLSSLLLVPFAVGLTLPSVLELAAWGAGAIAGAGVGLIARRRLPPPRRSPRPRSSEG